MRDGEYGQNLFVNVGEDISSATEYGIELENPNGVVVTKLSADGVTIGVTPENADCNEIFAANEYLSYVIADGDINLSGDWFIRSVIDINGKHFIGPRQIMRVLK